MVTKSANRMILCTVTAALCMVWSADVYAETESQGVGIWTSAGVEWGVKKGLDVDGSIEYRTGDWFSAKERVSAQAGVSVRLYRNKSKSFDLKAAAGYRFMNVFKPEKITYKGYHKKDVKQQYCEYNLDDAYTQQRHRLYAGLQASVKTHGLKISLRQLYQFTLSDSVLVEETKYRYNQELDCMGVIPPYKTSESFEWKGTGNTRTNIMRTRLSVSYSIPKSDLSPFASYEISAMIDDDLEISKHRWQLGCSYSLNKNNKIKAYYLYQKGSDGDEAPCRALGLDYVFEF